MLKLSQSLKDISKSYLRPKVLQFLHFFLRMYVLLHIIDVPQNTDNMTHEPILYRNILTTTMMKTELTKMVQQTINLSKMETTMAITTMVRATTTATTVTITTTIMMMVITMTMTMIMMMMNLAWIVIMITTKTPTKMFQMPITYGISKF